MQHYRKLSCMLFILITSCIVQSAEKNKKKNSTQDIINSFTLIESYLGSDNHNQNTRDNDVASIRSSNINIPQHRPMLPLPDSSIRQSIGLSISPTPLYIPERPTYYRCGIYSSANTRNVLEDKYVVEELPSGQLFAIFDGNAGECSAMYLSNNIANFFKHKLTKMPNNIKEALKKACAKAEKKLLECNYTDGATGIIAYIQDRIVYYASVGDCGLIIDNYGNPYHVSKQHTFDNKEIQRIKKAEGLLFKIINNTEEGPLRINTLLTPRTFGHSWAKGEESVPQEYEGHFKTYDGNTCTALSINPMLGQVIAIPRCKAIPLASASRWIILGSSGLWKHITPERAAAIPPQVLPTLAHNLGGPHIFAEEIGKEAKTNGSKSNITVLLIDLLNTK